MTRGEDHVIRTRIVASAAGAVALAAGLVFAPSALAADPQQCTDLHGVQVDCAVAANRVVVDASNGVLAGVKVDDTLCLRVEALRAHETADVRLRVPCPRHPVRPCAEVTHHDGSIVCKTPPVIVTPPVILPVPVAPAPVIVQASLPVTH
jgi:hypothetical protein